MAGLLVEPEARKLLDQRVGHKHISRAPALRDLPPQVDPRARGAVGKEDISDVEANNLAEAQAGAKGEGENRVLARVAGGGLQERTLLGLGEGRGLRNGMDPLGE